MSLCTTEELFDFMGAEEDVRIKKKDFINFLIENVSNNLENLWSRKITKTFFTDLVLKDNINCCFCNDKIYFKYEYRDIYSIKKILLNKNEINNYCLNKKSGYIILNNFIVNKNDIIEITGYLGLLDENEELLSEIKLAGMELIAVKSKLWTRNIYTLEGTINTLVLDISDSTTKILEKYVSKSF